MPGRGDRELSAGARRLTGMAKIVATALSLVGAALVASACTSATSTREGAPTSVRVSLILPAGRIVSGQRADATLVVENDSGSPVVTNDCVPPGESRLGQIGLSKTPPATAPTSSGIGHGRCIGAAHVLVGVGATRIPFVLEASTALCQVAPATELQVHSCLPGGRPLSPGTYYLDYDWYGPLPTPAITVSVTAP